MPKPKRTEPIYDMKNRRINNTLHGRSVYRPANVSGHNVFKGYTTPGHGAGLDLFGPTGTPVLACFDGKQVSWRNDTTKLEVIYLQATDGSGAVAVYAHINACYEAQNKAVTAGEVVGWLRGDLNDPHLHFEYWPTGSGKALAARTPRQLHAAMVEVFVAQDAPPQTTPVKVIDHATGAVLQVLQVVEGGWHPEQGKLYVSGGK